MAMLSLDLDDALLARLRDVAAAQGQDVNQFATALIAEAMERRVERERGLAEGRALLEGPARPLAKADAAFRAKHNLPDLSHLSQEEIAARADAALAKVSSEKRAEAERLGII